MPKTSEEEEGSMRRMLELVGQHPRWGYRRITVLRRREGWRVKRKRVYRLWRQQGLKVPKKQRKKRRMGHSGSSCLRRLAQHTAFNIERVDRAFLQRCHLEGKSDAG